jgi:peptidoglycan/xylan/chitin deacetylase (PgdA/CDA1 family)
MIDFKPRKSSQISSTIHQIAYRSGIGPLLAQRLRGTRILMYHGVPRATQSDFEAQIRFLKRYFDIMPLSEVPECLEGDRSKAATVALTFDDGLRNNLTVAYPVLASYGAPATFFVCPGLIESGKWLWNQEMRARLHSLGSAWKSPALTRLGCSSCGTDAIVEWMKSLPIADRHRAEETIREETREFRPSSDDQEKYDLMNWDEICELDPKLITIGSHTISHPILPTLSGAERKCEIRDSRQILESKLGRTVDSFCYPNGSENSAVADEVSRTYRFAVTTQIGFATSGTNLFRLPRIPAADTTEMLAWRMIRPTS